MPTSWPPNTEIFALGRRVLLVEDLALPAAVLGGVGAEIIEEGVAAEDAAVVEQHHAGQAALDAVEHAQVDGIETVDDAALADPAAIGIGCSSTGVITDLNTAPGNFLQPALEAIELRRPPCRARCKVASSVPAIATIVRIGIVADGLDLDRDLVAAMSS